MRSFFPPRQPILTKGKPVNSIRWLGHSSTNWHRRSSGGTRRCAPFLQARPFNGRDNDLTSRSRLRAQPFLSSKFLTSIYRAKQAQRADDARFLWLLLFLDLTEAIVGAQVDD